MRRTCGFMLAGLASVVMASAAGAQTPAPKLGVMGGLAFADLGGKDATDIKSRTGFVGGVFGDFSFSDNLGVRLEALVAQKGGKLEDQGATAKIKATYLEIPVLLRLAVPPKSDAKWAVSPHFYAGPAIAFKLDCKVSGEQGNVALSVDCDEFADEGKVRSTDLSGVVGAGLDFGQLTLGARYDLGFTKVFKSTSGTDDDVKTRTFMIYAGIGFRIRK